jgi:hypothetical protein
MSELSLLKAYTTTPQRQLRPQSATHLPAPN